MIKYKINTSINIKKFTIAVKYCIRRFFCYIRKQILNMYFLLDFQSVLLILIKYIQIILNLRFQLIYNNEF